jgi:hypothetical protein
VSRVRACASRWPAGRWVFSARRRGQVAAARWLCAWAVIRVDLLMVSARSTASMASSNRPCCRRTEARFSVAMASPWCWPISPPGWTGSPPRRSGHRSPGVDQRLDVVRRQAGERRRGRDGQPGTRRRQVEQPERAAGDIARCDWSNAPRTVAVASPSTRSRVIRPRTASSATCRRRSRPGRSARRVPAMRRPRGRCPPPGSSGRAPAGRLGGPVWKPCRSRNSWPSGKAIPDLMCEAHRDGRLADTGRSTQDTDFLTYGGPFNEHSSGSADR